MCCRQLLPMTDNQKNFLVTLGVCLGAGAVILGIQTRDRLDLGANKFSLTQSGTLASRENDREIPASQYFAMLTGLLKREYVDEVTDEMKLAAGAVRGMITSLGDTHSVYYDNKTFSIYLNESKGQYEGIGADLTFVRDGSKATANEDALDGGIPKLMVASVVPGGPADKAGVKPGYWVESINGIWVVNPSLQQKTTQAKALIDAKKMPADKLRELRQEIREKLEKNLPPLRAREKLTSGTSGAISVVWQTPQGLKTTTIVKAKSLRSELQKQADGSFAFRFVPGMGAKLSNALNGMKTATLDLRGNATGDYVAMKECLDAVAPNGSYGFLAKQGDQSATAITVTKGNANAPSFTILVDKGTQGVAEIFAKALASKGRAKIVGTSANDAVATRIVRLPTGSGYTLAVGRYTAQGGSK